MLISQDVDLQSSDQWELLTSVYKILRDYYQVLENDTPTPTIKPGRKRKIEEDDASVSTKHRKNSTPTAVPNQPTTQELEKYLRPDDYGPDPFLVGFENSSIRSTLPGFNFSFEPDKIDLAKQYLYIDQLVSDLHLLAAYPNDGKSLLTTTTKKDFFKKLNTECSARTELIRLSNQLPKEMREALISDKENFYKFFCREGLSISKPYLNKEMREKYHETKDLYHKDLLEGDILHVPFSENEIRTLSKFHTPLLSIDEICCYLPGRTGIDIIRYLEDNGIPADETYEQLIEQDMQGSTFLSDVITYSPSFSSSTKSNTLSTAKEREYGSCTSGAMEKEVTKSLLSALKYLGKSSAPTDAIVDCKIDPTGRTSKVIIGTAKGEDASAVNVSVLYDLQNGTLHSFGEHTDTVSASDFSIDGQYIITASYDLNIIVRDVSNGKVVRYLGKNEDSIVQHEERILNMVLHKSRPEIITTFSSRQIMVWNIYTGALQYELTNNAPMSGSIIDMCFGEGQFSDILVVGSEATNNKGELRLWDTTTSVLVKSMYEPRGMISSIATNSTSSILSATKSVLRLFDFRSPDETVCLYKTGQNDVNIVSFSPCERFIQSSATDNRCIIFDTRVPSRPLHTLCHNAPLTHEISGQVGINSAIWTRDGNFLMTGGEDGCVRLWDVMSGSPLVNSLESNSPICACDISRYYDMVIAGDESSTIKVWSLSGSQYTINDEDLIIINHNVENPDLFAVIDQMQGNEDC